VADFLIKKTGLEIYPPGEEEVPVPRQRNQTPRVADFLIKKTGLEIYPPGEEGY
jgi:hypothetical protein